MTRDELAEEFRPLSIVHLEDSPLDAGLVSAALLRGGVRAEILHVDAERAFREILTTDAIDLILSDYAMPDFDGLAALEVANRSRPEVPFLFVSGVMGEEIAIESLQRGATDYVLKQRLERLVPAVRRALAESRERANRQRAEAELRRSEASYRELSERLTESDARKDAFLATLAHELRNPLSALRNGLRAIRLFQIEDQRLTSVQDMMDRQSAHLERLLDDLLDISRVNSGKIELRPEPIDLIGLLDLVVESVRPVLEERRHRLIVETGPNPIPMIADPTRLTQVFANLLSNAAKYTPNGGMIRLATILEGDEVEVTVSDDGIGIETKNLPRIFDLFVQVDSGPRRSWGGLGIGLTLVRSLVELHGGRVEAQSDGIGRGSTFLVRLKTIPDPLTTARNRPGASLATTHTTSRFVLICDDNVDGAESLAMILRLCGHRVLVSHDGPSTIAMACAADEPIDLILLDIGMPEMSGYEVAARLRRDRNLDGTRIVALTGWGSERDRRLARESGFDAHFTKPIDPEALQRFLEDHPISANTRSKRPPKADASI